MATIQQLKEKGRFGDTELVHMSKPEVNALMRLATSHGKTLTNNPDTGLKEAFSLGGLVGSIAGGLGFGEVQNAGHILGGGAAQDAAAAAAQMQQAATDKATAENKRQFDIGQQNLAPWLSAGKTALDAHTNLLGLNGNVNVQDELNKDPGYQFRLQQGQKSLDAGLAARGGFGSGATAQAGIDYNQGAASQEYGNRLNQLASVAGTGQTAANQSVNQGSQFAVNQGNLWTNNANAQGAAGMAGANARQSGLMNVLNFGAKILGG
jgi:hypothetical protein